MTGLPDGWRPASIGEVAKVDSGPAFQSKLFGGPNEGTRLLRGDNIEPGALRWHRTRTWPDERLPGFESLLVEVGDIILAMDRPVITSGLKLGRVTPQDLPALLVQRVARIRATGVENGYLYHLLESRQFVHHLRGNQVGTQVPHITLKTIRDFPIPLPPINEQRRIVDILEDHLSRLDAAEQSLTEAHRRSELLRAVILESMAPADTPSRPLSELATASGYGTSTKCVVDGPGVPVVRIPNLIRGRVDLGDEKRSADATVDLTGLMLEHDDFLIVRTNGSRDLIGRAAVVQPGVSASFASYLIRFRLDPSQVRPEWVRVMFGTPSVRRVLEGMAASSAGQYNLGLKKLNRVTVPCPPIEDQDRLLKISDEHEWALESLMRSLAEGMARAQSLRRSLLDAAFSGRLTGRSSDFDVAEELADAGV